MATIYDMVVVAHDETSTNAQKDLIAETGYVQLAGMKIVDYFKRFTSGIRPAAIQTKVNMVKASGTISIGSFVQDDTITVNGVGFTGKDTPSAAAEFVVGGTATVMAAAFAACANTNTTLDGMVIFTSATTVVTCTALVPGELGNAVTIAISAHGGVSGARLTGGTNGDVERTHYYGSGA